MFGSQQTSIPSSTRSVFPFQVQLCHKVHQQVHLIPFIVEDNFTIAGQVEIKLNVGCWKSQMKKIELQKCRCQSPATTSPYTSMISSFTRKMWLCRWHKKDKRKLTLTLHPVHVDSQTVGNLKFSMWPDRHWGDVGDRWPQLWRRAPILYREPRPGVNILNNH